MAGQVVLRVEGSEGPVAGDANNQAVVADRSRKAPRVSGQRAKVDTAPVLPQRRVLVTTRGQRPADNLPRADVERLAPRAA
jgi:hypothetical protein